MKVILVGLIYSFLFSALAQGDEPRTTRAMTASKNGAVLVAAHRGGYSDDKLNRAPENSVANVALAIKEGYDVYETDIQRTSDGVFVIVHDPTIDRETNGNGAVENLTLAELKALKKRYRDGSLSDEPVATLDELLRAGKGKILFKPDLKPGVINHFDALARLIAELEMIDQVFLRTELRNAKTIKEHFDSGTPQVEVMFKTKNASQVKKVIDDFHPKTIQVDLVEGESISDRQKEAILAAVKSGVLVETHNGKDQSQWKQLAGLGVRMFHTTNPDVTLKYLKDKGWRNGLTE